METYQFSAEDICQIANLIKMYQSLDELYKRLYALEITNQKDSSNYQQKLKMLNEMVSNINIKYKEYQLIPPKSIGWYIFLVKKVEWEGKDKLVDTTDIESLMTLNYDYRYMRRLLTTLKNTIVYDYEVHNCLFNNENNGLEQSQMFYENAAIIKYFNSDLFTAYLYFLEEYINKEKNDKLKYELLAAKYNVSFTNENVENILIDNNFVGPNTLYLKAKLMADLAQVSNEEYNQYKNYYVQDRYDEHIKKILATSDNNYNDPTVITSMLLRQCFLRSMFLFMNEEELEIANYEFNRFLESEAYLEKHSHDTISPQLIREAFSLIKEDKSKVRILSFNN